jgi:hypothetical protein
MLAVDTNIVVRYLTADDLAQAKRARNLVDGNPIFVPTIVLLESEWVLRSYRLTREQVLAQLRDFLSLATVTAENPRIAGAGVGTGRHGFCRCAASRGRGRLRSVHHFRSTACESRPFAGLGSALSVKFWGSQRDIRALSLKS